MNRVGEGITIHKRLTKLPYPRTYADDTHLTYADKDVNIIQSCLNEDLLNISKWLIANKLTLYI